MSGYTEENAREQFPGHYICGFLQKPFTPEELRGLLRAALE